jgi:voltage-gated potassium channel
MFDRSGSTAGLEQQFHRLQQQLIGGFVSLIGIFWVGTIWYHQVEGWRWVDAAYMTMITLSTVGFTEVHPLGDRGHMFTMSLILLGVVNIGYIVNRFTEALIQGYFQEGLRQRQQRLVMDSLTGHYIVCGFGRMGRQAAQELATEGVRFVVADSQLEPIRSARECGYTYVKGDATLDETLLKLGIERAVCIIAALPSDAENLYIVLSAKTLNPQVRAIARASTEEALQKLQRAGADAVISPYITGGKRMAAAALRPQVMDFVEGVLSGSDRAFYMEEFLLDAAACPHVGETLRQAKLQIRSGSLVLAIRRANGKMISGPPADTPLLHGDHLICMGTEEQLRNLNQLLSPLSSRPLRTPKQG